MLGFTITPAIGHQSLILVEFDKWLFLNLSDKCYYFIHTDFYGTCLRFCWIFTGVGFQETQVLGGRMRCFWRLDSKARFSSYMLTFCLGSGITRSYKLIHKIYTHIHTKYIIYIYIYYHYYYYYYLLLSLLLLLLLFVYIYTHYTYSLNPPSILLFTVAPAPAALRRRRHPPAPAADRCRHWSRDRHWVRPAAPGDTRYDENTWQNLIKTWVYIHIP